MTTNPRKSIKSALLASRTGNPYLENAIMNTAAASHFNFKAGQSHPIRGLLKRISKFWEHQFGDKAETNTNDSSEMLEQSLYVLDGLDVAQETERN